MKILIINYFYPPIGRAHSFRWQELSQYWAEQGHDVSFVTSRFEEKRFDKNINLIEVGSKVSKNRFNVSSAKVDQVTVKARLKYLLKILYRKIYWPDGLWYWIFPLFLKLFKIRKQHYDYVVTYSPTFVSHLGGLFFKKISKKDIFWIADYGDPFSISESMQPNNFKLYRKLNYFFENKVLVNADKTVFTNEMTLCAYKEKFGNFRYEVIPHAVNIDKFYAEPKVIKLNNIRLVYVGSFHKGIREPYETLKYINSLIGIARLNGMNIYFDVFGPLNGIDITNHETDEIKFHGSIPRDEAIEKIKSANILINIENSNCVMSPSKMVEYLATGNPIVNFYHDKPTDLFLNHQSVINIPLNNEIVNKVFDNIFRMLEIGVQDKCVVNNSLEKFTIQYIEKSFLE